MKAFIFLFVALFNISVAVANDSSATLAAGGLELSKSADISIESEHLYISRNAIRVDYVFKNNSANDIETLVAFPLPTLMSDFEMASFVAVDIPNPDSENFVNFKVKVNHAEVPVQIEHKAFLKDEEHKSRTDISAELKKYAVPISPFSKNYRTILTALPANVKQELYAKKWLAENKYDAGKGWVIEDTGAWETQTSLYWSQVFPAHQTITVSHEYQPVVGSYFISANDSFYHQGNSFCIDKGTEKAIHSKLKSLGTTRNVLVAHHVQYILATAKNWQGPIKQFNLVLDKESPDNILSVCLPEIKKINKTQFSLEYRDFVPEKNLDVVIIE